MFLHLEALLSHGHGLAAQLIPALAADIELMHYLLPVCAYMGVRDMHARLCSALQTGPMNCLTYLPLTRAR